jgi:hypothetical protein
MSEAQLQKLKEDRDALAREVSLLNAAIKPEEASDKVVAHLRKAEVGLTADRGGQGEAEASTDCCCCCSLRLCVCCSGPAVPAV